MRPALPVAVAAAAGAAGITALVLLGRSPSTSDELSGAERARALAFLVAQPAAQPRCDENKAAPSCVVDQYGDVDGDKRADCWRTRRGLGDDNVPATTVLVWRGCSAPGLGFEVETSRLTNLVIPRTLGPRWQWWLASRFVGPSAVQCAGPSFLGCPPPAPAWQWILASAERTYALPGQHGVVTPRWITTPRTSSPPTALVIPWVDAGWMSRVRGSEEGPPPDAPAAPRILIDPGVTAGAPSLSCAGLQIVAEGHGIVAIDPASQRWTWLFRGLADYGGFEPRTVICHEEVVIATTGDDFGSVVAIDPVTGGWLFDPASDYGRTDALLPFPDGTAVWRRDGHVLSFGALKAWLAKPMAARPVLWDVARSERPELEGDTTATSATLVGRTLVDGDAPGPRELYLDSTRAPSISARIRATLAPRGTCQGWKLSASPTALLAERGTRAVWVMVERETGERRITEVRCVAGRIQVTRIEPRDVLSTDHPRPNVVTDRIAIDLARKLWWPL